MFTNKNQKTKSPILSLCAWTLSAALRTAVAVYLAQTLFLVFAVATLKIAQPFNPFRAYDHFTPEQSLMMIIGWLCIELVALKFRTLRNGGRYV